MAPATSSSSSLTLFYSSIAAKKQSNQTYAHLHTRGYKTRVMPLQEYPTSMPGSLRWSKRYLKINYSSSLKRRRVKHGMTLHHSLIQIQLRRTGQCWSWTCMLNRCRYHNRVCMFLYLQRCRNTKQHREFVEVRASGMRLHLCGLYADTKTKTDSAVTFTLRDSNLELGDVLVVEFCRIHNHVN